ncbi:unnamed protein product, partial [Didymodactylos carnosus]
LIPLSNCKVFTGGRGGGGGGFKSSVNRGGTFSGSNSGYGKPNYMSGGGSKSSGMKAAAMGAAGGAVGAIAAYSIMNSLSHSGRYHSGAYSQGYGTGNTCTNNEDYNGTRFGMFQCPLEGFTPEDKYCCGPPDKQFCCPGSNRVPRAANLGWLLIIVLLICLFLIWSRKRRLRRQKMVMIPMETTTNEPLNRPQQVYQPPYQSPYQPPYQSPYQPSQMPYPTQPTGPMPPPTGLPAYDDVVHQNQNNPVKNPY